MIITSLAWLTLPVYLGIMCGLALRLFNRTRMPGTAVLAAGFGISCFVALAGRLLTSVALHSFALVPTANGQPAAWYWMLNAMSAVLAMGCNVVILMGFATLCGHLLRTFLAASQETRHG